MNNMQARDHRQLWNGLKNGMCLVSVYCGILVVVS